MSRTLQMRDDNKFVVTQIILTIISKIRTDEIDTKTMLTALVLALLLLDVSAEQCEDLDSSLCDLMRNKLPETCGDACMSKFCKRSCGLCVLIIQMQKNTYLEHDGDTTKVLAMYINKLKGYGVNVMTTSQSIQALQCYQCSEVSDVSNCTTLTTCTDKDDYCFAAQTFTAHFTEAYRLGCGSRKTCLQYSDLSTKRVNVEAGCCNTDKCNSKPPPLLKIIPANQYSTVSPTDPNMCVNRDDDICTRLALHVQNPCSDDCIASKICPHMCKKCFYCLDCNEIARPENCTQTTACGYGKECYGLEKLGSNFQPAVQLGCIEQKLCQSLQATSSHIFGKRDFSFTGKCCVGDKCNEQTVSLTATAATTRNVQTASMTTTAASTKPDGCYHNRHHCPNGFHQIDSQCFLIGPSRVPQYKARMFCKNHCADMFYFNSTADLHVLSFLQKHSTEVYTDMVRNSRYHWYWQHNNHAVPNTLLDGRFKTYTSSKCATAYYNHNSHQDTYGIHPVSCNIGMYPLCMINLK